MSGQTLQDLQLTEHELMDMLDEQPSLRAIVLGYIARRKLRSLLAQTFTGGPVVRQDDHERKRRGTFTVLHGKKSVAIRCCSLQANSVKTKSATYQCDASDCRDLKLPSGRTIRTTCVLASTFDIVAVSTFTFDQKWQFAYAAANDLARTKPTKRRKLSKTDAESLLSCSQRITFPVEEPYTHDIFAIVDRVARTRRKGRVM
jgi:hypothetical protein